MGKVGGVGASAGSSRLARRPLVPSRNSAAYCLLAPAQVAGSASTDGHRRRPVVPTPATAQRQQREWRGRCASCRAAGASRTEKLCCPVIIVTPVPVGPTYPGGMKRDKGDDIRVSARGGTARALIAEATKARAKQHLEEQARLNDRLAPGRSKTPAIAAGDLQRAALPCLDRSMSAPSTGPPGLQSDFRLSHQCE